MVDERQEEIIEEIGKLLIEYMDHRNPFLDDRISVGAPVYDHHEPWEVLKTLLTGRVSMGPKVMEFENKYAEYMGVRSAIACNSGSSANLLALAALKKHYDIPNGSGVICPASTFATVAMPIYQLNMIPYFVDVDPQTLNINPNEIYECYNRNVKMIMPVHSLGLSADMPRIMEIATDNDLLVMEDCCEAHGSLLDGKMAGSWGDAATISFHVAHNMTTGEGGMVFTKTPWIDKLVRQLREFGRYIGDCGRFEYVDEWFFGYDLRYIFEEIGWNLRMTDIVASLGLVQLTKLEMLNKKRITRAQYLQEKLSAFQDYLLLPPKDPRYKHTYYGFAISVKNDAPFTRNEICQFLELHNIETRPFFGGNLALQPAIRNETKIAHKHLPKSNWVKDHTFFIGVHGGLSLDKMDFVYYKIKEFIENYR